MQIIFDIFENLCDFWTILYAYIVYCLRQFMGGVLPSTVYIAMRCLGVLSDFSLNLFARYFVTMRTISAEKEHFLCTILQFYLHMCNFCSTFAADLFP